MGLSGAEYLASTTKMERRIRPKQLNCSSPSMMEAPGYESTMRLAFLTFSAPPLVSRGEQPSRRSFDNSSLSQLYSSSIKWTSIGVFPPNAFVFADGCIVMNSSSLRSHLCANNCTQDNIIH